MAGRWRTVWWIRLDTEDADGDTRVGVRMAYFRTKADAHAAIDERRDIVNEWFRLRISRGRQRLSTDPAFHGTLAEVLGE